MFKRVGSIITAVVISASLVGCTGSGDSPTNGTGTDSGGASNGVDTPDKLPASLKGANEEVKDALLAAQKKINSSEDGKTADIEGDLVSNFSDGTLSVSYGLEEEEETPETVEIEIESYVEQVAVFGEANKFTVVSVSEGNQVETTFKGKLKKGSLRETENSESTFTSGDDSEPAEESEADASDDQGNEEG